MYFNKGLRICLDPGHGGEKTNGAVFGNIEEDDINLSVSFYLQYELQLAGFQNIEMTRVKDVYVALQRRVEIASCYDAELFISIHCDSFHNKKVHGQAAWVSNTASGNSFLIAGAINKEFAKRFPGHKKRGIHHADFTVLRQYRPSVLVECEFLSNPDTRKFLKEPENQRGIALCIKNAVLWYAERQ